ncbi:MAG: DUF4924 family protein [Tannerellaceae bacterium]|jgi:hypothetical protein|nr:DUF4924 family protein [Tannerellaceae bacterium]
MIIAEKKKQENIAEYLLYMWQIEDMIRANRFDIAAIRRTVISHYNQPEDTKDKIARWYEALIEKMHKEGVEEKGHLQEHTDILVMLTDLHLRLLDTPQEILYRSAYHKILPCIVQLRAKSGGKTIPELETCFTALYGYLMLKMQQKDVSAETEEAVKQVATYLSILSEKYENNLSNRG